MSDGDNGVYKFGQRLMWARVIHESSIDKIGFGLGTPFTDE